jgi:hypothetical protein
LNILEIFGVVKTEVKTSSKTLSSEITYADPDEMKKFYQFSEDLEKELERLQAETKKSEKAAKKLDEFNRRALGDK